MHEIRKTQAEARVLGQFHGIGDDLAMHGRVQPCRGILEPGQVDTVFAHKLRSVDAIRLEGLVDRHGDRPVGRILVQRIGIHIASVWQIPFDDSPPPVDHLVKIQVVASLVLGWAE